MPLWAGRTLALLGIALVALNLRTAVTVLSPIVAEISGDVPLGMVGLSLIGMLPPIAFAVSAVFGAALARRLGLERFLILAILAMVAGHLARALAGEYSMLFAGSVLVLLGMGVGNVLLPPLVKRYFPDRVGLVTALYVTVLTIGASTPAAVSAPVAVTAGWRVSLGMWAIVAFISLLPWLGLLLARRRERSAAGDAELDLTQPKALAGRIWHSPTAWVVAIVFAVTSLNAYSMFAWLPEILIQTAGESPVAAGAMLGFYSALGIPFALAAPALAARMKNIGVLIEIGAALLLLGNVGLLLAPAGAPWLWVSLIGCGQVIFPICLVLINVRSRTQLGSVALSGFAQAVSYTLAAAGPLLIGLMHEWSGGWAGAYILLIGSAVVAAIGGYLLRKPRFVEDDLQRRAQRLAEG